MSLKGFQFGVHACGAIEGITFTNSLEAFLLWYEKGIRIFEIDIERTDDGEYVACHIFSKEIFEQMEFTEIPSVCTRDWFLAQKLYTKSTEGLRTMDLESIFSLLKSHGDIMIMIDPKVYSYQLVTELLEKVHDNIEKYEVDGKRIVFELYNQDMIKAIQSFQDMVQFQYCIDDEMQMGTSKEMRELSFETQLEILRDYNIRIISYPWKCAVENLEVLKHLKEEQYIIFSKTKNNIFSELLEKAGVNVNLVDYLVSKEQAEELMDYKEEYYKKYAFQIEEIFGS